MELLIFYPLGFTCILLALLVVCNKNPVGSAVSLIGMMLGLAGLFVLLRAHFLAALQVLVYAGAIMVLFMFVIMLLNLKADDANWKSRQRNVFLSSLTGVLIAGILYKVINIGFDAKFDAPQNLGDSFGTTAEVGRFLFTDFVLPFEVASILLLAAMVGAVVLAKSKVD
ncbi:MAG: NADH-quinone oxidoreductase subunit J [Nitrospinota bacterium]|nr:NADH-quinone oxidoreductase subunit J [Nitrospinota bacterium]